MVTRFDSPIILSEPSGSNGWFLVVRINGEFISRESHSNKYWAVGSIHFTRKLHIQHVSGVGRWRNVETYRYMARLNDELRSSPKGKIEKKVG